MKSNFLKSLALTGLLSVPVMAFAATEDGVDMGAVQVPDEIGYVQVTAPAAVAQDYVFPARAAGETFTDAKWDILVKPELGVTASNFIWQLGAKTGSVTQAVIGWGTQAADVTASKLFEADTPVAVNLTDVAASPLFVEGAWNTIGGSVKLDASQTFSIVPAVGTEAGVVDPALSAAILAESSNYTYAEAAAVNGFSVDPATGVITVAQFAYGTYTVNVTLSASGDKWEAITTPSVVTLTVTPATVLTMTLAAPAELIYSGVLKAPSASNITVKDDAYPVPAVTFNYGSANSIDAGAVTATAELPAGYVFDNGMTTTVSYEILPCPIPTWTTTPTIAGYTFGDATAPAVNGTYGAGGVTGETLSASASINYVRWTPESASVTAVPGVITVTGGQGLASNYKVTASNVTQTATAMTVSYTTDVISLQVGNTATVTVAPVVTGYEDTADCNAFVQRLKDAVSGLANASGNVTVSGLDLTGVNVTAESTPAVVTAVFTPIANQAVLAADATSFDAANVTVTQGVFTLTNYKLTLGGTETQTIAYNSAAIGVGYTVGSSPLPSGTTWKIMKDGTTEVLPADLIHAGSYTYVPSNDNYTFTNDNFDPAFSITPIAIQLKFATAPADVTYGKTITPVMMDADGTPATGDTFNFPNAANDYTPWTTNVGETVTFTSVVPTVSGVAIDGDYAFTAADPVTVSVLQATFSFVAINPVSVELNGTYTFSPAIDWSGFAPDNGNRPAITALLVSSDETKVTVNGNTVTGIALGSSNVSFNATPTANYAVTEMIVVVTVQDQPFSSTIIWLSKTGTGNGSAFDAPASVSRFVAATQHTGVTEIRIIGANTTPVVVSFDTVTMPTTELTISSNWTGANDTATDNTYTAVLTGTVALDANTTLNNVIVDASEAGKTITFAGKLNNVTAKVSAATTLAGSLNNCVVFGATVDPDVASLERTAYQVATDSEGGDVVGTNMKLASSGDFSAKIGTDWKPMGKTAAGGKASILINRGSAVVEP